jgi:hypothetical protein
MASWIARSQLVEDAHLAGRRRGWYKRGMFGLFKAKLPNSAEDQEWVDCSFLRLAEMLGAERLLGAAVVLPTAEHFPDAYDRSEEGLDRIFTRVAGAMQVDASEVEVSLFASERTTLKSLMPFYSGKTSGAAGFYYHDPASRTQISIEEAQLKDPMSLVATLAHELGHMILLRPGLVDRDEPDMEPLNDLLTVFLGFGIFTANAAFRFEQHADNTSQGWSTNRQGYLSEEMFGYALARFALERGEMKPSWARYLSTNVSAYFKRSAAWLAARQAGRLFAQLQDEKAL